MSTDTAATADTAAVADERGAGTRRIVVVANFGDDVGAAGHLAALSGGRDGRVVVRPTPGASDLATLGLDVLVADGKSPSVAKTERVGAQAWELSRAWLRGRGVSDVVVDRAHLLTTRQAGALAEFAAGVGASLWLVWGGRDNPAQLYPALRGTPGPVVEQIGLWEFRTQLPATNPELAFPAWAAREWPVLPAANFTTFLAVCRRHLKRREFSAVGEVYYDTAEACDTWLAGRGWPDPGQHGFAAVLTGWLRDVAVGPAPSPAEALIRLRAVQAALFVHAIVLGWTPAALGPNPARRLLGDLTEARAGALRTGCRTDAAAATALSLHLNLTGAHFELLRIGDVAPDGSAIRPPTTTEVRRPGYRVPSTTERRPGYRVRSNTFPNVISGSTEQALGRDEFCCREPVLIPTYARSIFAAHRAYRVGQARHAPVKELGEIDDDPFFAHPHDPERRSPEPCLGEAIRRTCRRLRIDPPWIHGDDCHYGPDIGLIGRRHGWMTERGLYLHRSNPHRPVHIPRPPPIAARGWLRPPRAPTS